MRVLVVEDEEYLAEAIATGRGEREACTVDTSSTGQRPGARDDQRLRDISSGPGSAHVGGLPPGGGGFC